jgi:hypothetical protein
METTMPKTERNYLGTKSRFLLTQKIHTEYAASKLDDVSFAKLMAEKLGYPITASHVSYIRREFNIPSNIVRTSKVDISNLLSRIEYLEERMEILLRERAQNGRH